MFEILQQRHLPAGIISTFPTLGFYGWLRLLSEHGTITLAKAAGLKNYGFSPWRFHARFPAIFKGFLVVKENDRSPDPRYIQDIIQDIDNQRI